MGSKVFENKTPREPEAVCVFGEVYVSSQGMEFMNYCSARMPRLQPVVAHELLPYLELLIRGLMSPWHNWQERQVPILPVQCGRSTASRGGIRAGFCTAHDLALGTLPGQWARHFSHHLTLFTSPCVVESPPPCLAPCGYSTVFVA